MSAILELQSISKSFGGKPAVRDVSFNLNEGEICGFLGPNGAGKTTTLRMSLGLVDPSAGKVRLFGNPPGPAANGRFGFLPEERGLYKKMTARATMIHLARLNGLSMKQAKSRADELLERHGLGEDANRKLKGFSKGMAQKVQLLSAIAHDPEFLILDEPFSGLDPVNQKALEDLIRGIASRGRTILFSTHIMEHAERLCDRIILMSKGQKIFDGTMQAALDSVPRRVIIETPQKDARGTLSKVSASIVAEDVQGTDLDRLTLLLGETHKSQDILEACVANNIRLERYEPIRPSLHEAFVTLVEAEGAAS